jgi:peptidyl-prolyl cis-trans isomerase A (cyclophilin A)
VNRLALIFGLLAACDSPKDKPDPPQTSTTVSQEAAEPADVDTPAEVRLLNGYMSKFGSGETLVTTIHTTAGDLDCELYWRKTPRAVATFVGLASGQRVWKDPESDEEVARPYFDGTAFFRVVSNFVIQGGDPTDSGRGGPGFTYNDEILPELRFDRPGVLALANNGPNSNAGQFFITLRSAPHLDDRHTIFGACTPLDVVRTISQSPVNASGVVETPERIKKVSFSRR